jgi:hypothetical protein
MAGNTLWTLLICLHKSPEVILLVLVVEKLEDGHTGKEACAEG